MDLKAEANSLVSFMNGFRGESYEALSQRVNLVTNAKNKNAILINKIAEGYKGPGYLKSLCECANLIIKTVQLKENGYPKEAMSFPYFSYDKIVRETWDESETKRLFLSTLLIAVFQQGRSGNVFKGAFLWKMPESDLNGEVKEVWQKTVDILKSGDVVVSDDGKTVLAFPHEKDTKICHVRPHGRNSLDLSKLPVRDSSKNYGGLSKQSFWLNHDYVDAIVKKNLPA